MREIFTDLYKKVAGFFQAQEKAESSNAKDVAVNRMKLVLMQDRTNLTPFLLEKMRGEMIDVLAKYVEMDKEALELNFEQEGEQMALMLSIPVIRAKEEEEIQAAIEAEEKEKSEKSEQDTEETSEESLECDLDDSESEDEDEESSESEAAQEGVLEDSDEDEELDDVEQINETPVDMQKKNKKKK